MSDKETVVAKAGDLREGEMKAFTVGETKVLLCKIEGKVYAHGAFCTHYGAPLEEGVLSGERIVCPWHHAVFDARNGDRLEPPALDALPQFEVEVRGDDVVVAMPEPVPGSRLPRMVRQDAGADSRTFVILGGGAAANMAALTLREEGFQGRIMMVTQEKRFPYDRPNLSKMYLQGTSNSEWMPLRGEAFYKEYDIIVLTDKRVTGVDVKRRAVEFAHKEPMDYDVLLIATGSVPRTLNIPGASLKNVFTLRSQDDADAIIAAVEKAANVAVVGASFIGMETAYSISQRKKAVTVIAPENVPFEHIFGREVGGVFRRAHEEAGVLFKLGSKIERFIGQDKVAGVRLEGGEEVETDVVIVGAGVKPATDFLHGIDLLADGSIKVDEFFRVGEDVYAAGDIATFADRRDGGNIRIEHWRVAEQQGRCAARNMLGKKEPFRAVPFFWTVQGEVRLQYVGHAAKWDNVIIHGDMNARKFIAYYVLGNEVRAAAGCDVGRDMDAIEELMRTNRMPGVTELRKGPVDLQKLLRA